VSSVLFTENGASGAIRYSEGLRSIPGYYEFGGGDVIAIINMGSADEWRRTHAWAIADRERILRFVANEAIRQKAPSCIAQIDENSGDILLRQSAASTSRAIAASTNSQVKAARFVRRFSDLKAMLGTIVLIAALIAGAVFWLGQSGLTVAPAIGVPLNESVRFGPGDGSAPSGIASLIQATDPHLPNWSGRGGGETSSLSILIVPLDGAEPRLVRVARGLSSGAFSLARIIGSDGTTLWFDAAGFYGVRLNDDRLVTANDLRDANPNHDPKWWNDPRHMDIVDGRLHILNDDRSGALEIDPKTWTATPAKPKPSNARFRRYSHDDHLKPLSSQGLKDAALLRMDVKSRPLSFGDADGAMAIHTSAAGTVVASRLDKDGNTVWSAETGLDRFSLQRIFPGEMVVAFVGTRPPAPGKLSEPYVVLVDNITGKTTSHSLWR
jgi:hypothetical protein